MNKNYIVVTSGLLYEDKSETIKNINTDTWFGEKPLMSLLEQIEPRNYVVYTGEEQYTQFQDAVRKYWINNGPTHVLGMDSASLTESDAMFLTTTVRQPRRQNRRVEQELTEQQILEQLDNLSRDDI